VKKYFKKLGVKNKAVIIGGSAGSYKVVMKIISNLPKSINVPFFICLHRLRSVRNGFAETMRIRTAFQIIEPLDREKIEINKIYIAPANYHMIILNNENIGLSVDDEINHSRPSIDLAFQSAAEVYKKNLLGIILSGANQDGAFGLLKIKEKGGFTVAQHPDECEISVMPLSCIENQSVCSIQTIDEIIQSIHNFISNTD
jgi:two-component system, chemotaxis family, protein-glutamate methylesterase/glutaminase